MAAPIIWFYLFIGLLFTDGKPATTPGIPYATADECKEAGDKLTAQVQADDRVAQATWICFRVDLTPPATPHKAAHIPGRDEA